MSSAAINTVGWDIGGAHLKAVLLDKHGAVLQALQLPCPLWKGLDYLQRAILHALQAFKTEPFRACHAITMTGELVDLFENRQQGVDEISTLCAKLFGKDTFFYAANDGFVGLDRVSEVWQHIASTNWHASASALATLVSDALFVDIGSTTTDIIAIENGKVKSQNFSDASRMADDSLVYTGVVRTPVMALAQKLPFADGDEMVEANVAAEVFATMADVYRLTGELTKDDAETADGKGKTMLESARRLARMIGHDAESREIESWKNLANTCKILQMNHIKAAMLKKLKPNMIIIGAGAGSFLVEQIAHKLSVPWEPISMRLSERIDSSLKHDIEVCFPAFAVAFLLRQHA
jgi:(4-(4-[2-(gamma-L-glutamylamino)ethyl]phenoxymethyl)furan-2-yl)methanamine synthase